MTDEENRHPSPAIRSSDWCGIHVTQYQKNEPSGHQPNSSVYVLEVCIYDGAQVLMSSPPLSKSSPCWIVDASNGIANIVRLLFTFHLLPRFLLIPIKTDSRLPPPRLRLRHRRHRRRRSHPLFLRGSALGEQ